MCQWHMFSTDRSRAEMREHVVQSNPVSEGAKAFDPNIIERKAQWNRNGIRIIYKTVRVTGKRQTGQTGQTVRTGIPMKSSSTLPEEITAVAAA